MVVITVVSDTHATDGHRLAGRTLEAVRAADLVVHAGDLVTEAALDAFDRESARLAAVHGNNDSPEVRERVPAQRVVEADGARLAVVHGHEHGRTALSLFGRQEDADLVVFGHSHRPGVEETPDVVLLNPGSHAVPRQFRPAHAELEPGDGGGLVGRLVEPDGRVFETFRVP